MANLSSKTGTITTPVQTQISLANNATTSVQDMSAYDAQEVMGFVYVDATADLRAYFTVTVVKNGAGTYEIAGADIAGDQSGTGASAIAPVSFSMSGSILQATLPNITGFVSAYLRYQLSAPYLGGNYPLTVSARQVAGDVSGVAVPAGYIGEKITWVTPPANLTASTTEADWTNASLVLTSGTWLIVANIQANLETGAAAGNFSELRIKITDSANAIVQQMDQQLSTRNSTGTNSTWVTSTLAFSFIANLNSSTTYKIRAQRVDGTGVGSATVYNSADKRSHFFAVRIA